MRRACLLGVVAGLAVLGCTPEPGAGPVRETPSPLVSAAPAPSASPSETAEPEPPSRPVRFDAGRATADVRHLAGRIGPRRMGRLVA